MTIRNWKVPTPSAVKANSELQRLQDKQHVYIYLSFGVALLFSMYRYHLYYVFKWQLGWFWGFNDVGIGLSPFGVFIG